MFIISLGSFSIIFILLRGTFYYSFSCYYIATLSPTNYTYIALICFPNCLVLGNVITGWIMFTGMSGSQCNVNCYRAATQNHIIILCASSQSTKSQCEFFKMLIFSLRGAATVQQTCNKDWDSFYGSNYTPHIHPLVCAVQSAGIGLCQVSPLCALTLSNPGFSPLTRHKKKIIILHEPGIYYEIISFKASHNAVEVNQWYEFYPLPVGE